MLVERPSGDDTRHIGSGYPEAVPPAPGNRRVETDGSNVGEGNLEPALQGPELVPALDFEDRHVSRDRHVDRTLELLRRPRRRPHRRAAQRRPHQVPATSPAQQGPSTGRLGQSSVGDILRNPKYTGYQVFNRRAMRSKGGKVNDPRKRVWSPQPAHEPLIPKWMFDELAARRGSRASSKPNTNPKTKRTYPFRGRVFCPCGRRMSGSSRRGRPPHDDVLTPTEWRVVHAVQHGMSNREIAARRGIRGRVPCACRRDLA